MPRKPLTRLEAGLPAPWYFDPAHYQRELEAFWYGRWIAAAREEEIPQPGHWRVVPIGSQRVILLRNEKGELRAFHNTCRHRGSVLCTEERGSFARRRIVCPYHSWTYDLAGKRPGRRACASCTTGCSSRGTCRFRQRTCSITSRYGKSPTGRTRRIARGSSRESIRASSAPATTCRRNSTATASLNG